MHVAVAQVHSGNGVRDVLERIECQTRMAAIAGADVILFAECVLQGYDYDLSPGQLAAVALTRGSRPCSRLVAMAQDYRLTILAGFLEKDRRSFYNSVLIAQPDGSRQVQRKHVLTAGERKAGLSPGPRERVLFNINGICCAILICADTGIEGMHEELLQQGVEYRFVPTGGGGRIAEMLKEKDLQRQAAREQYCENRGRVFNTAAILKDDRFPKLPFASANALGPVGRRTCHQGHCMITDANYVMRAQIAGTDVLEHQQDQMVHAVLNFPQGA